MPDFISTSDLARQLGVAPRCISDLFYQRKVDDSLAPIVAGRRVIRTPLIPAIEEQLRKAGHLPAAEVASA